MLWVFALKKMAITIGVILIKLFFWISSLWAQVYNYIKKFVE